MSCEDLFNPDAPDDPSALDRSWLGRKLDQALRVVFKMYGIDEIDKITAIPPDKTDCRKYVDMSNEEKSADFENYKKNMNRCASKYGKMLQMQTERDRQDVEAFVRQPKNLRLMLPSAADANRSRLAMLTCLYQGIPLWMKIVAVAMFCVIGILLLLPMFFMFIAVLTDFKLLAKTVVIFITSTVALLVCVFL
jgi:hypothetical protein